MKYVVKTVIMVVFLLILAPVMMLALCLAGIVNFLFEVLGDD